MLMRLSKSTGIDGLAGMALVREQDGVSLLRPLLPVRKSRLEATCEANEWEFVRDPSNASEKFSRARLRSMQEGLAQAGFTVDRLLDIAREAGTARAQLETACNAWLQAHASLSIYGAATLSYNTWKQLDRPMRLRTLSRALVSVGGAEYPPRGASLERLAEELAEDGASVHTLGGCRIEAAYNSIGITREAEAITDEIALSDLSPYRRWDNRFVFSILPRWDHDGITVRALKNISRKTLVQKGADSIAALPALIRSSLPGLFIENDLLGVPALVAQAADLPRQALVSGRFSPAGEFLVKVFRPSSFMLT
jgi:tRNA(Ile)-lysidine synthase